MLPMKSGPSFRCATGRLALPNVDENKWMKLICVVAGKYPVRRLSRQGLRVNIPDLYAIRARTFMKVFWCLKSSPVFASPGMERDTYG